MFVEFHRRFKWAPRFTSKLQILNYYGTTHTTTMLASADLPDIAKLEAVSL
jgi:hypothetical protein